MPRLIRTSVLVCLLFPAVAQASPIGLSTAVTGSVTGISPTFPAPPNSVSASCSAVGTSSATCNRTLGVFDGTETVGVSASASYDALAFHGAYSTPTSGPSAGSVQASAAFIDELTISGGTGVGYVQYVLDGSAQLTTDNGLFRFALEHDGTTQPGFFYSSITPYVGPVNLTTALLPFTWDLPFLLEVSAFTSNSGSGGTGHSDLDLRLAAIRVFDAEGNLVTNASVYSAGQASVPEPGTIGLIGLGLSALVARFNRRRVAWTLQSGRAPRGCQE